MKKETEPCANCEVRERAPGRSTCLTCKSRLYTARNPERRVYFTWRANAKRREIPFYVTLEEWLTWTKTRKGRLYMKRRGVGADDYTLDRIDEEGPYTIANLQVLKKGRNSEKYHRHYRAKVQRHYDSLMSNLPF